ncbi:MAG: nitronate monooxygenase [Deltaproteobacteria bacterium]|nr:nitronate monooxygenase [Deltaproteobacteria bacterium]
MATGRQVAASLSLGAELVYMGTRFIASTECGADEGTSPWWSTDRPRRSSTPTAVSGCTPTSSVRRPPAPRSPPPTAAPRRTRCRRRAGRSGRTSGAPGRASPSPAR